MLERWKFFRQKTFCTHVELQIEYWTEIPNLPMLICPSFCTDTTATQFGCSMYCPRLKFKSLNDHCSAFRWLGVFGNHAWTSELTQQIGKLWGPGEPSTKASTTSISQDSMWFYISMCSLIPSTEPGSAIGCIIGGVEYQFVNVSPHTP